MQPVENTRFQERFPVRIEKALLLYGLGAYQLNILGMKITDWRGILVQHTAKQQARKARVPERGRCAPAGERQYRDPEVCSGRWRCQRPVQKCLCRRNGRQFLDFGLVDGHDQNVAILQVCEPLRLDRYATFADVQEATDFHDDGACFAIRPDDD